MLQFILKYGEILKGDKSDIYIAIIKSLKYFCLMINLSSDISSMFIIASVFHYKKKYEFQNYIIGNLTDYYFISNNTNYNFMHESKSNTISSHYNYQNNNDLFGSNNNTNKNNNNNFYFRKLVSKSFCHEIYNSFIEYKGKPLSYIFDFNLEILNRISIVLFIINFIFYIFYILIYYRIIISFLCPKFCEKCTKKVDEFLGRKIIKIIIMTLSIPKFVLFIIFLYYFEKGDLGKYENFLECKYVRKKYFSKFPDIDSLLRTYKAYWISTIISESSDKLEIIIEIIIEIIKEKCRHKNKDEKINNNNISNMSIYQNNSDMANINK